MPDEQKTAPAGEQASQAETSSAESPESASDAQEQPQVEKAPEADERESTQDQGDSGDQGQEKPTRAQRRIQELTGKLKETKKQVENAPPQGGQQQEPQFPWQQQQDQPLVQPGQELTPEEYTQHVRQQAAQLAELQVRKVLAQEKQRSQFSKSVDDWVQDAESLQRENKVLDENSEEYDPEIAEAFSKLVARTNTDERGNTLPKVKPSEIWADFNRALSKSGQKRAGEVSATLAKQQAQSATPPTSSARKGKDYEDEEMFHQAAKSGRTEDWASYLKKRMFDK